MWRNVIFISFICSVTLNVYLLMQININTIEKKIQPNVNTHSQDNATHINRSNNKLKDTSKTKNITQTKDINNAESAQHIANKIKDAINAKDYFNASFLIHALASNHETELSNVKQFWLHATKALIKQSLFTYAEDSIDAYLAFNPDDSDFLYQQVDLYWQQHMLLLAIKHAYDVQYHLANNVETNNAINTARALVQQQIDVLTNNNLWLELIEFIEEVLLFDPQNDNLQWFFVRAQYQLGEFEYARNAIEPLLNQPNYKIKAQALLADIEAALRKPQSIPLSRQGEHFIVQAVMNDTFNVSLMLDTGASISLLSEPAFDALKQHADVVYVKDLRLNTAGGQVTASIYQVNEFAIQGYIVKDFIFAVSPFTSAGNDGLLGMNFLKHFDFHIDQNNNVLMLSNK